MGGCEYFSSPTCSSEIDGFYRNYLNFTEAKKRNIIYGDKSKFYLRADNVTTLDPWGVDGRDSARIKSKKTFGKHVAM